MRIPLTQAGFQPASALLETLRASSARSQAGSSAPSTAGTGRRRKDYAAATAPAPAAPTAWAPGPLTQGLSAAAQRAGPASPALAPGISSLVARLRALPAVGPTPGRPAAAASSPAPALAAPSGLRGTDDLVQRLKSLRQGSGPAGSTPLRAAPLRSPLFSSRAPPAPPAGAGTEALLQQLRAMRPAASPLLRRPAVSVEVSQPLGVPSGREPLPPPQQQQAVPPSPVGSTQPMSGCDSLARSLPPPPQPLPSSSSSSSSSRR